MNRHLSVFLKGAGMGAADGVPGISGGTIAFVTGIYEEFIHTIKQFGPSAFTAWRQGGWMALYGHLNLAFAIPLGLGIVTSLFSIAHLVTWLMAEHALLLDAFIFGLVFASVLVVMGDVREWRWWHLLPLLSGLMLAKLLPALMPFISSVLNAEAALLIVGGAIAISAMLLPGVSGTFLLLTMGLYGRVMEGIKTLDLVLMLQFGMGCIIGLFFFSRLLSWLLRQYYTATLQLVVGFILGSLPLLWPWRELTSYRLGPDGQMIPLAYRYLTPGDYTRLTAESAQLLPVLALMLAGLVIVLAVGRSARKQARTQQKDGPHA